MLAEGQSLKKKREREREREACGYIMEEKGSMPGS